MIDDMMTTRSWISPSTKIITYDTRTIRPPRLSRTSPTDLRIKGQGRQPGAILGARSHSRPRTTPDAHGTQTAVLSVKARSPDQSRRLAETYGSEGWGFESLRVRQRFA